jgi:hypothetical protein
MSDKAKPATWTIVLRPMKSSIPPAARMKRLLKLAKRTCQLHAVSVEEQQ